MPPRHRIPTTDPLTRLRNEMDALGRPGMAGKGRVGFNRRGRGGAESVLANVDPAGGASAAGRGQMLLLTATAVPIASGGDYVTFDTVVHQNGFGAAIGAGVDAIVWPTSAIGAAKSVIAWDTYAGGGTVELEVDGTVPAWGLFGSSNAGGEGRGAIDVDIEAGSTVRLKVTQASGTAQTCDVTLSLQVQDPTTPAQGTYQAVVLADGPIAYWRLGETSGTEAFDETGNGHTGTYTGAYTLGADGVMADGSADKALELAGIDSSGVLGAAWADLEFAGTATFSVECWFNPDAVSGVLVQKQASASGAGWEMVLDTDRATFNRIAADGTSHNAQTAASSITASADYYLAATYDGSTLRMYLNGTLVDSDSTAVSMGSNSEALSIGYDSADGTAGFDGTIDEVAIYGSELTAAEIRNHWLVGRSG